MKIKIQKDLQPQLTTLINGLKSMEINRYSGYESEEGLLIVPSNDIVLNEAVNIARIAEVGTYEYWVEVPDANIDDDIPEGVSYETYLDEFEVEQTRTWAELGLNAQGDSNSLRFWQPANNTEFLFEDVELIEEAGFTVYGKQELQLRLNDDEYADTGDPEYVEIKTIKYIDQNWRFGGYLDFMDAWLSMQEIYEAKDTTDALRWAASTTAEKKVLVRWNQVGLNRANDLVPGSWSEAKAVKELARSYREFNIHSAKVLLERFDRWYQYLNLVLSGAGRTKFASDWDWILRHEYVNRHLHFYELGTTNALLDWHDTVLATYVDADFITSTLTANQLVTSLRKVLANKKYFI